MKPDPRAHGYHWPAYYEQFPSFSADRVRAGAHPRALLHATPAPHAVVLGHGLAASPFMLMDIALHLHARHGFDVYLPLLDRHGLEEPNGMKGVTLEAWKANMQFGIATASARSATVGVGGVSTGAALGLYEAATNPAVNGPLLLFSAALRLAGGVLPGAAKRRLLQTPLGQAMDVPTSLVQDNPYGYAHVDLDGARELAKLIDELEALWGRFSAAAPLPVPVFAAHSKADQVIDQQRVEALTELTGAGRFVCHMIAEPEQVTHPSVVLHQPIRTREGEVLHPANTCFAPMIQALDAFLEEHLA